MLEGTSQSLVIFTVLYFHKNNIFDIFTVHVKITACEDITIIYWTKIWYFTAENVINLQQQQQQQHQQQTTITKTSKKTKHMMG